MESFSLNCGKIHIFFVNLLLSVFQEFHQESREAENVMEYSEPCQMSQAKFAQTEKFDSLSKKDYWGTLFNSTFPALCSLLARSESELGSGTNFNGSSSAVKELEDIFGVSDPQRGNNALPRGEEHMDIPLFDTTEKFDGESPNVSPVVSALAEPNDCAEENPINLINLPPVEEWKDHFAPEFCRAGYHEHVHSKESGMLQICTGPKFNVYRTIDNKVREMDSILRAPVEFLGPKHEESCMLNLPGPYSCSRPVRKVKFQSNRYVLDVLGLFLVLVDTVLSTKCVTYVNFKGSKTPLEFAPNIAKVIKLLQIAFPEQFAELQKLVMYSTITSVMKKSPLKWNRCMIYVLEDLLIHPVALANEDSLEQALIVNILQKRAKMLLKRFASDEDSHIFNSVAHFQSIQQNFSFVKDSTKVTEFMKISASNCLEGHRIKNIRFEVKDKLLELYIRDICLSYANFI